MKRCSKCIMPESKPNISFNEQGVCNACQNAEENDNRDWNARWDELIQIIVDIRFPKTENKYNCLIPVSGGKDSTFLAFKARELGLNPLCVNVRPCEPTELGRKNLENLSQQGFDIFSFIPNQKIMPKLVKRSFYEDGDPCTSHEFMLYSVPLKVALQYEIPLIVWAENPQFEYGNEGSVTAADQRNIGGLWGRPASHWLCDGVAESDLISFEHPTEIKGLVAIYLSEYIRWNSRKVAEFAIEHGFETRPDEELLGTGGYWNFEQLDDEMPIIGHYLKYQKFGYGRATDQACRDIRLGFITREEGLKLAEKYDGKLNPDYIERFCKYIDITETEFHRVCDSFYRNPVIIKEN